MIIAFIIAACAIAVDLLTKHFLYGKSMSLIGDFLWLESPSLNTGASFGIFGGKTIYLIIFSIPVIAVMIYLIISKRFSTSKFFKASLGLVLGGTIGNLIDRIALGGVRDFIYLKSINFAIFNFADIFINVGVFLLIIYFIITLIKDIKKSKQSTEKQAKSEGEK